LIPALKKHWYHIHLALAEGPAHGAEIRRQVKRHAQGGIKLYPAMLYGSLEDLQTEGWIEETDGEPDQAEARGDRARPFALTGSGRSILVLETRERADVLRIARSLLGDAATR
jgi:DNA-binding PadR family transcriptional regulator